MHRVIKQMLAERPFQPFRIHLTSGSHYDITDPAKAVLAPDCLRNGGSIFAVSHIVSIEGLPTASESEVEKLIDEAMRRYPKTFPGLKRGGARNESCLPQATLTEAINRLPEVTR